ncbi:MAG: hypothetical protein ACYTDY_09060 [Planctomycetota bacterium]
MIELALLAALLLATFAGWLLHRRAVKPREDAAVERGDAARKRGLIVVRSLRPPEWRRVFRLKELTWSILVVLAGATPIVEAPFRGWFLAAAAAAAVAFHAALAAERRLLLPAREGDDQEDG